MLSELTTEDRINLIGELQREADYREAGRESVPESMRCVLRQLKQLCLPPSRRK